MQVGPQQHQRPNILHHVRRELQLICLLIPGKAEMTRACFQNSKNCAFLFWTSVKYLSSSELF